MTEQTEDQTTEAKPKAAPTELARGAMCLPLVYAIKYMEDTDQSMAAIAKKYFTTVGKINDLLGGSARDLTKASHQYLTVDVRFTQPELDAAKAKIIANFTADNSDTDEEDASYSLAMLGQLQVNDGIECTLAECRVIYKPKAEKTEPEVVYDDEGNVIPPAPIARKVRKVKAKADVADVADPEGDPNQYNGEDGGDLI